MNQKVVIIGIGYTSKLGLIRSIASLGAEISVISLENVKLKPLDYYCKYVSHYYFCHGNSEERLMYLLTNNCIDKEQKVILIPNNDFSTTVIDKNANLLKEHFLFPHINHEQGAITDWMNKEKQKNLAKSCGIKVANANNVVISNGSYQLSPNIKYPCFTKTRAYVSGYKQTLHKCLNEKELRDVLDFFCIKFKDLTVMIEDYMDISKEYAVVGFSDGKNVIIPGIIEILLMISGKHKGVACQGSIMPISGFENLVEKFKRMILEIGFVGLFDIDFYLSEGEYYFGEINLRIGGSGSAVSRMGVNLPAMFVKSLIGQSNDDMQKEIKDIAIYANERICCDYWQDGDLSTKEFCRIMKSSSIHFLKDKCDKKPLLMFRRYLIIKGIKRLLKKRKI